MAGRAAIIAAIAGWRPDGIQVDDHLRVAGEAAGLGRNEQRIDFGEREFPVAAACRQCLADCDDPIAPCLRFARGSNPSASATAPGVGRAKPSLGGTGLLDLNAALRRIDHAQTVAGSIDHNGQITLLPDRGGFDQAGIDAVPFSRLPSRAATAPSTPAGVSATNDTARLATATNRHLRLDDPRAVARQRRSRHPSPAHHAGTAMPCSAHSAFPSASISSTSERSQTHDTVRHIEVTDDLLADQIT